MMGALKEKLRNLNGHYTFRFDREEDCEYLFEQYGGEARMKEEFPAIYRSFLKARERAAQNKENGEEQEEGWHDIELIIDQLPKNAADACGGSGLYQMSSRIDCTFIDVTQSVSSPDAAKPWIGISCQMTIRDVYSHEVICRKSAFVPQANSFCDFVKSEPMPYEEIENGAYVIECDIQGKDAAGSLHAGHYRSENVTVGQLYMIDNISVEHPAPQNTAHLVKHEIMMLYGRLDEQAQFKDADYRGGDYHNNVFDKEHNQVRLLLPFKGTITMSAGTTFKKLYKPQGSEKLDRMMATYDYKGQIFKYWDGAASDEELYDRLKDCFSYDAQANKVSFDIKLSDPKDTGRSCLDWHQDISGIANGDPKTIMFKGTFTLEGTNQGKDDVIDQITVKSITEDILKASGREYYKYEKGTNTICIPPITVYWGCFGRDVSILLADGTEKPASDIRIGDRLLGDAGRRLTVSEVLTGQDAVILEIKTKKGHAIKVTGGHHMRKDNRRIRASRIVAGDSLDLADGTVDEVVSVEQVAYHDTVYNFIFEGEDSGNFVIANGFYSGDLRMQNEKDEKQVYELTEEDWLFIAEMMSRQP